MSTGILGIISYVIIPGDMINGPESRASRTPLSEAERAKSIYTKAFINFFQRKGLTLEQAIAASHFRGEPWIIAFNLIESTGLGSDLLTDFTDGFGGRIGIPTRIDFQRQRVSVEALLVGSENLEGKVDIDFSGEKVMALAKAVNKLTGDDGNLRGVFPRPYEPSILVKFSKALNHLAAHRDITWTGRR